MTSPAATPAPPILVTGATGTVGQALIPALKRRGASFVAAVRDPARADELFGAGAATRRFDFADSSTFAGALEGIERVFLLGPPLRTDLDAWLEPFIAELETRGIRRVVYLSAYGMDLLEGFMGFHRHMEERLREGFAWTILRPGFFSSNFALYFADQLERGFLSFPSGKGRTGWIDPLDIGECAAVTLTEPGHAGQIYTLTGPQALDFDQVAALLTDALQRPIRYQSPSIEEFEAEAVQLGFPGELAHYLSAIYALIREGHVAALTPDVERLIGRPPTALASVIARTLGRHAPQTA